VSQTEEPKRPSDDQQDAVYGSAALRAKRLLIVAGLLAGSWWASLAAMALLTSNPVTLNRLQIRESQLVVSGTVQDLAKGTVTVEQEWKVATNAKTLSVSNLAQTAAREGETYLLPLSRNDAESYRITPALLPNGGLLIYPAVPEALEQLRTLLAEPAGKLAE
jgi:hypothetical protein